jgi:hypothetical protein
MIPPPRATRLSGRPRLALRAAGLAVALVATPAAAPGGERSVVVDVGARAPSSPPVEHVFGGRPLSVPLVLHGSPETHIDLRARLVQTAAGIAIPAGADIPLASNLDFSTSIRRELSFDVAVPEVQRKSAFELVVLLRVRPSETWRPATRLSVRAYPTDLMAPLRRWSERHPLRVRDASGTLERFLTAERIAIHPLSAALLEHADERTLTLLVGGADDVAVAKARAAAGETVVVIRDSSADLSRALLGVWGAGPVAVVHFPLLGRLSVDPLAQSALLDIIRSARALGPRAEEGAGHEDAERP